jgi:hypothetical protein
VFRARQAQALADAREPEQAVEIAGEVVGVVAQTGSARMRAELFELHRRMKPWRGERLGRALDELLADMSAS